MVKWRTLELLTVSGASKLLSTSAVHVNVMLFIKLSAYQAFILENQAKAALNPRKTRTSVQDLDRFLQKSRGRAKKCTIQCQFFHRLVTNVCVVNFYESASVRNARVPSQRSFNGRSNVNTGTYPAGSSLHRHSNFVVYIQSRHGKRVLFRWGALSLHCGAHCIKVGCWGTCRCTQRLGVRCCSHWENGRRRCRCYQRILFGVGSAPDLNERNKSTQSEKNKHATGKRSKY